MARRAKGKRILYQAKNKSGIYQYKVDGQRKTKHFQKKADANFYSLRHIFATRSLEQGMDAVTLSRLLGYANPSITLDKYGHALDDHKRVSVAKLGDIYSAKP